MIKALIAWGIGFGSGIKYVITRGLGIGAVLPTPSIRTLIVLNESRTLNVIDSLSYTVVLESRELIV